MKWIRTEWDGIKVLLVFMAVLFLAFNGILDWVSNELLVPLIDGFSSYHNENYTPAENFTFN